MGTQSIETRWVACLVTLFFVMGFGVSQLYNIIDDGTGNNIVVPFNSSSYLRLIGCDLAWNDGGSFLIFTNCTRLETYYETDFVYKMKHIEVDSLGGSK